MSGRAEETHEKHMSQHPLESWDHSPQEYCIPEDGYDKFLRNPDKHVQGYTT
jgi:hypothetical protein